jgi:type II secretory pathway component PulM
MNENKSSEATPDQLLQMLDLQIALQRQKRKLTPKNRAAILAGGLLLIVVVCLVALSMLQQMATDIPRPMRPGQPTVSVETPH